MTNKSPIFPFQEPQHFSDYGFDPQIDYFQVLEEARKHKQRETTSSFRSSSSIIDNLHFKLQKPISKDNDASKKIKKTRQRWWKNAFHFFKRKRTNKCDNNNNIVYSGTSVRAFSGPVYFTDTISSGSPTTPYHHRSNPSSGPLSARGDFDISIPYISLTQLNMDHTRKMSTSPMPIYLVT